MKEWEKDVPPDLRPAVAHLRESFDDAHDAFGMATRRFCYARLHDERPEDPTREYFLCLMAMKRGLGSLGSQRFAELTNTTVQSSIFKGFFDLYLEGMVPRILAILSDLIAIGRVNEERLGNSALEWAEAQARHLVSSHRRDIKRWVRDACDVQVHSPGDDPEETFFWQSWQAPSLVAMRPSGNRSYEDERAWERNPPETSAKWLESFADHYVQHLEGKVKALVGFASLQMAKQSQVRPPTSLQPGSPPANQQESGPHTSTPPNPPTNTIWREARKLETRAKYRIWQTEYRRLKKKRPDKSDVWYAQQIAKLPIGDGSSAETIRKHMTQK
jgi:hypothetical protein